MYDCGIDFRTRMIIRRNKVDQIRDIRIMQTCICCKRRVEAFWDFQDKLVGKYIALENGFSEIFFGTVADPTRILCNKCWGSGLWKKKGIELNDT